MFRLPIQTENRPQRIADVIYNISMYCIVGQIGGPNRVSGKYEDEPGPIPTDEELMKV